MDTLRFVHPTKVKLVGSKTSCDIYMFSITHLGQTDYEEALKLQLRLRELRRENKIPNTLLLTSHPPVFTLGKRNCDEDFLSSFEEIEKEKIKIFRTNRGGKITYHGPGQIVGYFIVDIRSLKISIPVFVRKIEEILIRTISSIGLEGERDPVYPGVWIKDRKIAAIGLHFDRGISMHGFALNVNPNLAHYRHIIPCGIKDKKVTSIFQETGAEVSISKIEKTIQKETGNIFQDELKTVEICEVL